VFGQFTLGGLSRERFERHYVRLEQVWATDKATAVIFGLAETTFSRCRSWAMRYFFYIKGLASHLDGDGTELSSIAAARDEASKVLADYLSPAARRNV
jgi:hypothetical protein